MLLTIENIFKFLQDVSPMIGNNFSFKTITENCGNKYTSPPQQPQWINLENFEEFCF